MSDGYTHAKATCVLCVGSCVGSVAMYASGYPNLGTAFLWGAIGIFRTLFINPDLDVDGGNISHYILRSIFPPLEKIWGVWRRPYSGAMMHRSFLSHGVFVSTAIRFAYSLMPPCVIFIANDKSRNLGDFGYIFPASFVCVFTTWVPLFAYVVVAKMPLVNLLSFFLGAVASDTLHYIMDIISTFMKKYRRN